MLETTKIRKCAKGKLAISGLAVVLVLSGCSFNIDSIKSGEISKNKLLIETNDGYDYNLDNTRLDDIMGFSKDVNEDKKYLEYTYLIDNSKYTNATFAHVIEEKTITSDGKLFDGKEEVSMETFGEEIIQPITVPISFVLFNIENVPDLLDGYSKCDITAKKMITLDGDILYYFESELTFNSFAERVICLDIADGDTITAKALYKLNPSGMLELLYRNQEGIKADTDNVVMNNFNNSNEIVIPLEKTIFADMDGKYSEKDVNETLKEYKKY